MEGENSSFLSRFDMGIEEIILLGIIILNIFDVLEIISPEWDYVKKIISWTALGLILYNSQFTKLFSGIKKSFLDKLILSGFFLLITKDLVSYSRTALEASVATNSFLQPFFSIIVSNSGIIESTSIYLGIIILLFASIRLSFLPFSKNNSVFKVLHLEQKKEHINSFPIFFKRTFFIFLTLLAFFIIVFNLIMQWLAIAIDAPLLMIAIISYIIIVFKKHKKLSATKFLFKFGNFGDTFYKNFLGHLKDKRTALRIVSGMLVLHLITDALTYLMPLLFNIGDDLYLSLIPHLHPNIFSTITNQITLFLSSGILYSIAITLAYLVSLFSLLVLLGGPILLMTGVYLKKSFKLPRWFVSLFLSSLIPFIGLSLIKISSLTNLSVFGVDFYVQQITNINSLVYLTTTSIIIFAALFFSSKFKQIRVYIDSFFIITIQTWFVIYIGIYAYSVLSYYINSITFLAENNMLGFLIFFILSGLITALFYLVGTIFFVEDTHKHSHNIIKESVYHRNKNKKRTLMKK